MYYLLNWYVSVLNDTLVVPNAFCVACISVHEIWESKRAKINTAVFHMSMAESYASDLIKLRDIYIL